MMKTLSNKQIVKEWMNGCRKKLSFTSFNKAEQNRTPLQIKYNKQYIIVEFVSNII